MTNQDTMLCSLMIGGLMIGMTETAFAKGSAHENPTASSSFTETVKQAPDGTANNGHDRQPGPAWRIIGGTLTHITGATYTVEDYEGNQVQLYVSRETKHLRGRKKVGDRVRAEITRGGFANSIQ